MGTPPARRRATPAASGSGRLRACAVLVVCGIAAPAGAAPPPRDPNDLPTLPPPHAQPRSDDARWDPPTATGHAARRRVSVSLVPSFASFFRARFLGRPDRPTRGGGAALETDIHLIDPVWLRLVFSHTAHPVEDEFATGEDEAPVQTAAKGTVQATHAGLGIAYGLDLGRVLPLLDVGVGALWIRSPPAVQDGQLGGACVDGTACDTGLVCDAGVCRVGTTPAAHAGLGLDVMLGEHWSVGGGLRYFALLLSPGSFPIYLTVGVRLGARF